MFTISDILFIDHQDEPPPEQWKYVLTATGAVGVAWVIAAIPSLRAVARHKKIEATLRQVRVPEIPLGVQNSQ